MTSTGFWTNVWLKSSGYLSNCWDIIAIDHLYQDLYNQNTMIDYNDFRFQSTKRLLKMSKNVGLNNMCSFYLFTNLKGGLWWGSKQITILSVFLYLGSHKEVYCTDRPDTDSMTILLNHI